MLFSKDIFASTVDTDEFDDTTRFIDVPYMWDEYNTGNRDNTMLHLFVLSCSIGSAPNTSTRVMSSSTFNPNKKARTMNNTTYNRYFLVADLENPPYCAAILPRTTDETSCLLSALNGLPFVGSPFCCNEPYPIKQTLGDDLPILQLKRSPFLPLKSTENHLFSTENHMTMPTRIGETNYFILTNKEISLSCITVSPEQTCLGVQCDRQKPKGQCTCHHSTSHNSSVYEFDVAFPIPASIYNSEQTPNIATVNGFRSLRTTKLFFKNYDTYCTFHTQKDQVKNRLQL